MGARVIGSLRPGPLSGRCGLHVCVRLPEIHRTRHDCGGIEKAPFLLGWLELSSSQISKTHGLSPRVTSSSWRCDTRDMSTQADGTKSALKLRSLCTDVAWPVQEGCEKLKGKASLWGSCCVRIRQDFIRAKEPLIFLFLIMRQIFASFCSNPMICDEAFNQTEPTFCVDL